MPPTELTLTTWPWPLNDLARELTEPVSSFRLNAPCHRTTLLEQCAGLAQAAQLAAEQCQFPDPDHQQALVQSLTVLAGYTKLARELDAAIEACTRAAGRSGPPEG